MSGELFGGARELTGSGGGEARASPWPRRVSDMEPPVHGDRGTPRRSRPGSRGAGAGRELRALDAVDAADAEYAEYAPVRDPGPADRPARLDRLERALQHQHQQEQEDGPYGPPPPPAGVQMPPQRSSGGGLHQSAAPGPAPHLSPQDFTMKHGLTRDTYILELQAQNGDFQRELGTLKRELELTGQKLGSSMHSIKTFWSPELKKERQMRKEESAKYALMGEQIQLLNSETQKQAGLIRQLEEELRSRGSSSSGGGGKNPAVVELQQQLDQFYVENDHLTRENTILKETVKELELRIEAQKQTLLSRDESIKKLLEMLQHKGLGGKSLPQECLANMRTQSDLAEAEARIAHLVSVLGERDIELDNARQELDNYIDQYRRLQAEIQQRLHQSPSTLTGILEVKDRRIECLEQEVVRLDSELGRVHEQQSAREARDAATASPRPPAAAAEHKLLKDKYDEARAELQRRDQDIMALTAKLKTQEEQQHDYQRHIAVLKESLCAKEEHYNMLQADVEELRQRLEEKNRTIDKKTQSALQASQERNRLSGELNEVRDHLDIKERKINVLQRKLDLQEAQQRLSTGHGDGDTALQQRLEEQRQLAAQRDQQLQKQTRQLADSAKQLDEARQQLQLLQARVQQLQDAQASGDGGSGAAPAAQLAELQAELAQLREEQSRAQSQSERLLHLMQMSQEEQAAKDRQIRELQDALKKSRGPSSTAPPSAAASRATTPAGGSTPKAELHHQEEDAARLRHELRQRDAELERQRARLGELEAEVAALEAELAQAGHQLPELAQMVALVKQKAARCHELEGALREAVRQTEDREAALHDEAEKHAELTLKMQGLESRLTAMQQAAETSCSSCTPLRKRLHSVQSQLHNLHSERRRQLEELFDLKQEALASAVSEKDAHLALLEVSGIRDARTAEQAESLSSQKQKLVERMRQENECRVRLLSECEAVDVSSLPSSDDSSPRLSPVSS